MGDKRVSKRTLDSGEVVLHHPPDDAHPEGKMELLREMSVLRDFLDGKIEDNQARHDEIKQVHQDRIDAKRRDQKAKGLPGEKSAV